MHAMMHFTKVIPPKSQAEPQATVPDAQITLTDKGRKYLASRQMVAIPSPATPRREPKGPIQRTPFKGPIKGSGDRCRFGKQFQSIRDVTPADWVIIFRDVSQYASQVLLRNYRDPRKADAITTHVLNEVKTGIRVWDPTDDWNLVLFLHSIVRANAVEMADVLPAINVGTGRRGRRRGRRQGGYAADEAVTIVLNADEPDLSEFWHQDEPCNPVDCVGVA